MGNAAAVKELPMLFNDEMSLAIWENRKTQTRRPAKLNASLFDDRYPGVRESATEAALKISRYQIGTRIWVREAWAETACGMGVPVIAYRCGGAQVIGAIGEKRRGTWQEYLLGPYDDAEYHVERWRPSIHMPRWASRLTLEITEVRVQRLQEISEADAQAEGVEPGCLTCGENCSQNGGCGCCRPDYRDSFIWLWNQINGAGSWDANPWVWAITFKRIEVAQ